MAQGSTSCHRLTIFHNVCTGEKQPRGRCTVIAWRYSMCAQVENSPGEYVLSVVTEVGEQTQERLLGETDRPLLERLQLGPDDQNAKIFLKERRIEPDVTVPDTVKLPIMEEEEEEETLPAEVCDSELSFLRRACWISPSYSPFVWPHIQGWMWAECVDVSSLHV